MSLRPGRMPAGARLRGLALLAGCLLLAAAPAWGQTPPTPAAGAPSESAPPAEGTVLLREQGVWDFAELLFRQGEYYRAVSEYKRLLYYFPRTARASAAQIRIGEALLLGGEPRQAIDHLSALLARPLPPRMDGTVLYLRGLSFLELQPELPFALREGHIQEGLADLRRTGPGLPNRAQVEGLLHDLDAPPDLPEKSPWLAAGLSTALPGLGSAYVGNYSEAALAFFANALLIAATVSAVREEQVPAAAFFGTFALAFYGGNIYAAANGAIKHNDRAHAGYLAERRAAWGIVPQRQGLSATFLLDF